MGKLEQVDSVSSVSRMKYKNKLVKEAYTEELLFELIQSTNMLGAPIKKIVR